MPVPYTFATATTAIPLSQLDNNFATAITLGNTAIQLGNTVTTLNNMTLANVTISSGTVSITNVAVTTANVSGTANISTLVVVGNSTMGGNVSVGGNVSISVNTSVSGNASVTGNVSAAGITASSDLTLSGGTANGVLYLNGSKVATSGSALTFDGTYFTVGASATTGDYKAFIQKAGGELLGLNASSGTLTRIAFGNANASFGSTQIIANAADLAFITNSAEQMRLTSTGLGIGTSSPAYKLDVRSGECTANLASTTGTNFVFQRFSNTGGDLYAGIERSTGGFLGPTGAYEAFFVYGGTGGMALGSGGNGYVRFLTNNTEKMRLDTSGNLGLGVTPSAWGGGYKGFDIAGGGAINTANSLLNIGANAYFNGTNWIYSSSDYASRVRQYQGAFAWYTAASGTAGDTITFTQAMTLNASGNLGVGTTSPTAGYRLHLAGSSGLVRLQRDDAYIQFANTANTDTAYIQQTASVFNIISQVNGAMVFGTNSTERARITSGGYFKASNTGSYAGSTGSFHELRSDAADAYTVRITQSNATPLAACPVLLSFTGSAPNDTTAWFLDCTDNTARRAYIRSNGGFSNYQANDTNLSDRREKTNFSPAKNYLDTICAIPVQTFNYIDQAQDDPGLTLGVVAQDVQAVAPELVMESNWGTEEEPKMRLSIYQTDLQYALMKCIQEQQALIQQLTARVAQLESN